VSRLAGETQPKVGCHWPLVRTWQRYVSL